MLPNISQKGTSQRVADLDSRLMLRRMTIVLELEQRGVDLWERLGVWWTAIADQLEPGKSAHIPYFISMSTSLAKMERNLVAGLAGHQAAAA